MAEKKATPVQAVPKYPKEELVRNARALFNVQPEVLQGALYSFDSTEMTVQEAKQLLDQFLKRKVN